MRCAMCIINRDCEQCAICADSMHARHAIVEVNVVIGVLVVHGELLVVVRVFPVFLDCDAVVHRIRSQSDFQVLASILTFSATSFQSAADSIAARCANSYCACSMDHTTMVGCRTNITVLTSSCNCSGVTSWPETETSRAFLCVRATAW